MVLILEFNIFVNMTLWLSADRISKFRDKYIRSFCLHVKSEILKMEAALFCAMLVPFCQATYRLVLNVKSSRKQTT
jgi:hypothetical protein